MLASITRFDGWKGEGLLPHSEILQNQASDDIVLTQTKLEGKLEIEIPNCACGERMSPTLKPDVFYCPWHDGIQPQELVGFAHMSQKQDRAFEREMDRREREWFSGQFRGK